MIYENGDIEMNDEYYEVKRNAYAVTCITNDYHGSVIVWDTLEQAEKRYSRKS